MQVAPKPKPKLPRVPTKQFLKNMTSMKIEMDSYEMKLKSMFRFYKNVNQSDVSRLQQSFMDPDSQNQSRRREHRGRETPSQEVMELKEILNSSKLS